MNLPNRITLCRIILSVIIIVFLVFPFDSAGIAIPQLFVNESIVIDIKYLIAGVLFIIASLTDFVDGYIARKYQMVTDLGKMLDAIADKMLVNSILIILATILFQLVTLPVEFDASKRAKEQLEKLGIVDSEELEDSNKMLFSAALTYVAGLLSNLLQLLRLVLILGSRRDD